METFNPTNSTNLEPTFEQVLAEAEADTRVNFEAAATYRQVRDEIESGNIDQNYYGDMECFLTPFQIDELAMMATLLVHS